jgi:hypothetical protein
VNPIGTGGTMFGASVTSAYALRALIRPARHAKRWTRSDVIAGSGDVPWSAARAWLRRACRRLLPARVDSVAGTGFNDSS